jgi:hypothetical protein
MHANVPGTPIMPEKVKIVICFNFLNLYIDIYTNRMPNTKIRTIGANSINKYINVKRKLLNCNANIYFNTTYLQYNLIPNKMFRTNGNGSIAPRSPAINVGTFVYLYKPDDDPRTETCSVTVI